MTFSINKHGVGRLEEIRDHRGKLHKRQTHFFYNVGESTTIVEAVDEDDDHMLYQYNLPITKEEYEMYRKMGVNIPLDRVGECVMCSCGSNAVIVMDSKAPIELQNKLVCKCFMQFGIHQTSMIRFGNQIRLPDNIANDHLMLDSEIERENKEE